MSRFYGSVKGNAQTEASRVGGAQGVIAHVRGWDIGGRVRAWGDGDNDRIYMALTGGSNSQNEIEIGPVIDATRNRETGEWIINVISGRADQLTQRQIRAEVKQEKETV